MFENSKENIKDKLIFQNYVQEEVKGKNIIVKNI